MKVKTGPFHVGGHPDSPSFSPVDSSRRLGVFALGLSIFLTFAARGQDAAGVAPADTTTYIQINGLAGLRGLREDPLLRMVFDERWSHGPQADEAWGHLEKSLGMKREEVFDRYLGRKVAVLFHADNPDAPGVVVSAVSKEDANLAVTKLNLMEEALVAGVAVYKTRDGGGRVAFSKGWMVLSGGSARPFMDRVLAGLAGGLPTLAEDEAFAHWAAKVPPGGTVFLFHREPAREEFHAVALRYGDGGWKMDHAGASGAIRGVVRAIGDAPAGEFGPMPRDALAVAALNVKTTDIHPRLAQRFDRLLAPKTMAGDVLPRLAAPIVLGVAGLPPGSIEPPPPFAPTAVAAAIKMRDPSVAGDLDQLLNSLIGAMNLAAAARGGEAVSIQTVGEGEEVYRVADLGGPFSRRMKRPELAGIFRIAYGRVGDWYVVSTHDSLFVRCREARGNPDAAFRASGETHGPPASDTARPLLAAVVSAPEFAAHLRGFHDHIKATQPRAARSGFMAALSRLAEVLSAYRSASVQAQAEEDGSIRSTVRLLHTGAKQ